MFKLLSKQGILANLKTDSNKNPDRGQNAFRPFSSVQFPASTNKAELDYYQYKPNLQVSKAFQSLFK